MDKVKDSIEVDCPQCGGDGIDIDYTTGCCGNANKDGSCCNIPIPTPIQIQCHECHATGKVLIPITHNDENTN